MNYKKITVETLSKIAIGLLVIIAISILAGTFQSKTFETVSELGKSISELKEQIVKVDETIAQSEIEIAESEEKLPSLEKAKTAAKKKLEEEKAVLEPVCDRKWFSFYLCDNPSVCGSLHSAVSAASSKFTSATDEVINCEQAISSAKKAITNATEQKENLNIEIKGLSSLRAKASWSAFFLIIAMLLAFAGIVFISRFLLDRTNTKNGIIACGLLAGSSLLYMILPTATTFLTYLLGIAIFAIFAGLISGKIQKRITARVFAIVFSVIIFAATLFTAPFTALCSAVAFVLVSLVLVPCVFTEYLDIAKHIFFTIITFGIWHLIWMYNFTENLNKVGEAEKRAPIRELLLCVFLPLYYIFWTYKTAGNTELYAEEKGRNFNIDILCLVLSVINPLLASVIIQDKTNIIVGKPVSDNVIEEAPIVEVASEEVVIAE